MTWEGTEENYNVFRWYRAGWGRYTQADPIRPAYPSWGLKANARFDRNKRPEVSSKIEPYAYAGDSPLNSIDALGLARCIYLPIQALSDYQPVAPTGTYKGCIYIGTCGGINGDQVVAGIVTLFKYVPPGCPCPLWCTDERDNLTGRVISKTTCFSIPLSPFMFF